MARQLNGWVAVSWAPHSRRSEMFARELGGRLHCISYLRFQAPLYAAPKYLLQAVKTLSVLFAERPRAVHVQNPPFVCALVVHLYCLLSGARYVIEHHSAAFDPIWNWALPFQKLIARRAVTNIVTSEHWADLMERWGARSVVMHDPYLPLPEGRPYDLGPGPNVAFISTFAEDEPLDAVLAAAQRLPDVSFLITGDTARLRPETAARAPANVTFTGFLDSNGEYLGLLRGVDVVMVLTTRDHTLQLAGCEAIAVGQPLVTSDWPYLRDLFAEGAVFAAPTPESIAVGVRAALERRDELAGAIPAFIESRQAQWDERLAQLRAAVDEATGVSRPRQHDAATKLG